MQHAPPLRMPPPPPPAGTRLWEGHDRGVMTGRRRCAEAAADCACACTCGSASLVADAASEQRAAALRRLQDVARREVALLEAEHAFVQREAALDAREAQLRAREEALLTAQRLHTQQQKQRASGLGGVTFTRIPRRVRPYTAEAMAPSIGRSGCVLRNSGGVCCE